jgi:hypothetical protein
MSECCYIPDGKGIEEGCHAPAVWRLYPVNDPLGFTEACTEHVGELLTDAFETVIIPMSEVVDP